MELRKRVEMRKRRKDRKNTHTGKKERTHTGKKGWNKAKNRLT